MTVTLPPVLIVGTGLIGTSIGLALRQLGGQVWLADADPAAASQASTIGAGDELEFGAEPDLIVIAVPPVSVAAVADRYLALFPTATVTDVASVKAAPLAELVQMGSDLGRFVGGHPMAGREVSGPNAGRADLFQDRLWAVTPTEFTDPSRIDVVKQVATACGAIPIEMDAARHDHAVALTSHTPQILSSVLAGQLVLADADDVALSGQGLRDVTRLAASSPALWTEILAGNATEVAAVIRRLNTELSTLATVLEAYPVDTGPLIAMLEAGNQGRAALPAKHGGAANPYETVHVVVNDSPGELARLFAAAGAADVNLEDVRIEHTVGRLRAVVELDVAPALAGELRSALESGGWTLRS